MRRRRQHEDRTPWQGFADMAMGLMAVLALLLVVMVARLRGAVEDAERESKNALLTARDALSVVQSVIEHAREASERQRRIMTLLARTFVEAEGCELRLDPLTGNLAPIQRAGGGSSDFFFGLGDTALTPAAADAMQRCSRAWKTIATCMAPEPPALRDPWATLLRSGWPTSLIARDRQCDADGAAQVERVERYRALCKDLGSGDAGLDVVVRWSEVAQGVEALLLEGHTDRVPYQRSAGKPTDVGGLNWNARSHVLSRDFLTNASLGAERARSALAHILATVQDPATEDPCSSGEILRSRLQVVSPSFGFFMAGPKWTQGWRDHDPIRQSMACTSLPNGGEHAGACDEARTLRLRIRWKDEALRTPLVEIHEGLCADLGDEARPLGHLMDLLRREFPTEAAAIQGRCPRANSEIDESKRP